MSRKSMIDPALKVELIERYLGGEIGIKEGCRLAGISDSSTKTFRQWIAIYENEGPCGLMNQKKNRYYSEELKLSAVNAYLNGDGSKFDLAKRYGLRSDRQLQCWIKMYNTHGEIKSRAGGGGSH
ncbi:MAG: hypothetical protein K5897_08640, partial [Eubacterium sp.]|nr:hypothetical protein [Eubacterium sp.]